MEVIKRGVPPDEIIIDCTCSRCNSELRFSQGEAELKSDNSLYSGNYYTEIKCPVCGYIIINNYVQKIINPKT